MKIPVLLTCHNRREKTTACLTSLLIALERYNGLSESPIAFEVYLTDDGCTDGTVKAIKELFRDENKLHIVKGNGNLFWAGGMRLAWGEALKRHNEWDYYLLINDDVEFLSNVFDELFKAQSYSIEHFGKEGLVSGITCDKENPNKMTYGGSVYTNRLLGIKRRIEPNGDFQICDLTNANILLVPSKVVGEIGILDKRFKHVGDYDYTFQAHRKGWPLILTAHFCGKCENDHRDPATEKKKVLSMNLKQRIQYFNFPTRCIHDQVLGEWTKTPLRAPVVLIGRVTNMLFPRFYYWLDSLRSRYE